MESEQSLLIDSEMTRKRDCLVNRFEEVRNKVLLKVTAKTVKYFQRPEVTF